MASATRRVLPWCTDMHTMAQPEVAVRDDTIPAWR